MTVSAESGTQTILGKRVRDLQTGITIDDEGKFDGVLKYVTGYTGFSGDPELQSGNYLAVKFSDIDPNATSVKVGLVPSAIGMDLVEIINDPDKNGVFRVTSLDQKLKVVSTDGTATREQLYDLSSLTLNQPNDGEG